MKRTIAATAAALASAAVGLVLAVALAAPAQRIPVGPSAIPPALKAWLATPVVSSTSVSTAATPQLGAAKVGTAAVAPASITKVPEPSSGERLTQTRGGPLLWTSNIIEWYWNSTQITSSSAWQTDGYIFPNTAKLDGIRRTLATTTEQSWRGTETVGAGVVTPWGAVDVYEQTVNDYFQIYRGGSDTYSSS